MAKAKQTPVEETTEIATSAPRSYEELMASFSPEELADFAETSGQAANSYDRIPTLKINYCTLADRNGNTIKEGNWVILQNNSKTEVEVEDDDGDVSKEIRIEDIGIDLGKSPKITIYTFGSAYSFYPEDGSAEGRCRSQLVFNTQLEKHVGNNLPYECRSGKCPRRQNDCAKAEKCSCQWVIFCEVTLPDGDKLKAILYAKGSSYMPFSDFIKSLGVTPIFFAPIKLGTKQELSPQGKPYYVQTYSFLKDKLFTQIEIRANGEVAKSTKSSAAAQNTNHKNAMVEHQQSSAVAQLVDKSAGKHAVDVTAIEDDDIEF